jgi:hypothetical protein
VNDESRHPEVQVWFDSAPEDTAPADLTDQIMAATDRLKRRRILIRIGLALLLALLMPPLQDFGLATTQILLVSLIAIDGGLVAELLAPINTVGAALSAVLFAMRAFYKRLFD